MKKYRWLVNLLGLVFFLVAIIVICLHQDGQNNKYAVNYQGWSTTDNIPSVYRRSVSGGYAYIRLYKRTSLFSFRSKVVSLEKEENLRIFSDFLKNGNYDGMGNYIKEDAQIVVIIVAFMDNCKLWNLKWVVMSIWKVNHGCECRA